MKVLLVSDTLGLGIMEARPEPAWLVRMSALRNKDLLAPDYGAMHIAAYLKASGRDVHVINVVADVHRRSGLFEETAADPGALSGSGIALPDAAMASRRYMFDSLRSFQPDALLFPITVYSLALYQRRLLSDMRDALPGVPIVTGGIYSTFHAGEILGDGAADIVVRGEGELTVAEVLDALERGGGLESIPGISYRAGPDIVHNEPRGPIADLDRLPHPYTVSDEFDIALRFEILTALNPAGDYIPGAGFLTSRGCPEACTFCLDPALNRGRTRFHSPEYVREVLGYCASAFPDGAGSFFFGDATFTLNRKRLRRILELIADLPYEYRIQTRADYLDAETVRMLADGHFTQVAIGAESFNEEILRNVVRKRLSVETTIGAAKMVRDAGMNPVLTFIVGLPGESRDSIRKTIEVLRANGLPTATFFPLVVFKGTELFELLKERSSPEEMDALRVNPYSEEFLFVSEEFPTPGELTGFVDEANAAALS